MRLGWVNSVVVDVTVCISVAVCVSVCVSVETAVVVLVSVMVSADVTVCVEVMVSLAVTVWVAVCVRVRVCVSVIDLVVSHRVSVTVNLLTWVCSGRWDDDFSTSKLMASTRHTVDINRIAAVVHELDPLLSSLWVFFGLLGVSISGTSLNMEEGCDSIRLN